MKNFNLDQKCSFLFFTYICVLCNISIIEKKSASIYLNLSSEMRQKIKDCLFCMLCIKVHPHVLRIAS